MAEQKQTTQAQEENILAVFPRSFRGEELRVKLDIFKGKPLINFRTGYFTDAGEWLPTRKGCTFNPEEIDQVIEVLQKAKTRLQGI